MDYINSHIDAFKGGEKSKKATYLILCASIIAWGSGAVVNDTLVDYDSRHGTNTATDSKTVQVVTIYFQVMASFITQIVFTTLPGVESLVWSNYVLLSTFAKHILIDGLSPPVPVMIMSLAVFVCLRLSSSGMAPEKFGRFAFAGFAALNVFVFKLDPETPLLETFPGLEGDALVIGLLLFEVLAFQQAWLCANALTNGSDEMNAFFWLLNLGLMIKHHVVDEAGPPLAFGILFVLMAAWLNYDTFLKDKITSVKKKSQ